MEPSTGVKRVLICLAGLALLKISEYFILGPKLEEAAGAPNFYIKNPRVNHPRCDACRVIASRLDDTFREADSKIEHLGQELSEQEVVDIVNNICTEYSFRYIELIEWEGYLRLAVPPLETWEQRGRPALSGEGIHWPERMAKHCHHMADKMKGIEIYDLWLRTGHSDPAEWFEFLCEGEGVFGDCLVDIGPDSWPAEVCMEKETQEQKNGGTVKAFLSQQSKL
eukprot:GFUD01015263.1.p1 GENE.GFUD01015263.1~~GFUD01015263.1.p1  ORF type:complete len:258 (+),score=61.47 GFUD01015263.1:103-774(+)